MADYAKSKSPGFLYWVGGIIAGVVTVIVVLLWVRPSLDSDWVILQPRDLFVDPMFEMLIKKDMAKIQPEFGEWGSPSFLEEVRGGDHNVHAMRKRYAMNVNVSDRIPYNRSLPETRYRSCRDRMYDVKKLPFVSLIVVMRDEAWTVLMRTLHSIVNRTDPSLIKELLIVDDGSDHPGMNHSFLDKLEYFISTKMPKYVHLIRLGKKLGVVPARLRGAEAATGEVLVFMDAHCEVNNGWLPPLLERIQEDKTVVVEPVVDLIDWETFEYEPFFSNFLFSTGSFSWGGLFEWKELNYGQILQRKDHSQPHKTPVLAGGIFAVDREFFFKMGSFDEKMYGWGVENIEFSIRIWSCGGSLEIIPCSRVGHVFRHHSPESRLYEISTNRTASSVYNLLRTARVWWGDHIRLLYQHRPSLVDVDSGDLSSRLQLRADLKCHPFPWYLKNVNPIFEMDHDALYSGRLTSATGFCLTMSSRFEVSESLPILYSCTRLAGPHYFALSKDKMELRREYLCAVPVPNYSSSDGYRLRMVPCDSMVSTNWILQPNGTMLHERIGLCLDAENGQYPVFRECINNKPSQIWSFPDNATLNAAHRS